MDQEVGEHVAADAGNQHIAPARLSALQQHRQQHRIGRPDRRQRLLVGDQPGRGRDEDEIEEAHQEQAIAAHAVHAPVVTCVGYRILNECYSACAMGSRRRTNNPPRSSLSSSVTVPS